MARAKCLDCICLALWAWGTMAPLRYTAKFDPFFPWMAPPSPLCNPGQSKERKGSNLAVCLHLATLSILSIWPTCTLGRSASRPSRPWACRWLAPSRQSCPRGSGRREFRCGRGRIAAPGEWSDLSSALKWPQGDQSRVQYQLLISSNWKLYFSLKV